MNVFCRLQKMDRLLQSWHTFVLLTLSFFGNEEGNYIKMTHFLTQSKCMQPVNPPRLQRDDEMLWRCCVRQMAAFKWRVSLRLNSQDSIHRDKHLTTGWRCEREAACWWCSQGGDVKGGLLRSRGHMCCVWTSGAGLLITCHKFVFFFFPLTLYLSCIYLLIKKLSLSLLHQRRGLDLTPDTLQPDVTHLCLFYDFSIIFIHSLRILVF